MSTPSEITNRQMHHISQRTVLFSMADLKQQLCSVSAAASREAITGKICHQALSRFILSVEITCMTNMTGMNSSRCLKKTTET